MFQNVKGGDQIKMLQGKVKVFPGARSKGNAVCQILEARFCELHCFWVRLAGGEMPPATEHRHHATTAGPDIQNLSSLRFSRPHLLQERGNNMAASLKPPMVRVDVGKVLVLYTIHQEGFPFSKPDVSEMINNGRPFTSSKILPTYSPRIPNVKS